MLEWNSLLLLTRSPFLVLLSWEKRKGKVSKVEINYSLSSLLLLCSSIANFYYYDEEYESDWHHSLLLLFSNLFEDAVSGILFLGPE